ncbi:probable serine/threonine-protein kinase At1g54610 [Rutidosis leptorrhynchoides]|uniref:probable serine/threonine-protein kinase At1g54610 n=1 Tax=Rutidosis leptorrhynchoides TaxID=125765 RepID=UPI003A9A446B
MGCICSKHVAHSTISPIHHSSLTVANHHSHKNHDYNRNYGLTTLDNHINIKDETQDVNKTSNENDPARKKDDVVLDIRDDEFFKHDCVNKRLKRPSFSFSIKFGRSTVAEHVAAGWPAWLSAVAGEVVDGWLPLKSDSFERFEKIGQGTYSNVYRARDLRTDRMMALKKVRFDSLNPESVRFMTREITILRKLDHPNIMKLEGIITSRSSSNIYLVFEYMEHDLAGLLSSPNIRFNDSQIKCYMWQLLKGIEHCHSRGILHRDIKTSNILVNNEGQLKIADFGLAKFVSSRQPLTSRVVTLWYRPPELLLGSTQYGTCVDMWSVGCVFAELFVGRPILKGRTEVEQLHRIFMLCGTPSEDYWNKPTLPLAKMSKPRHSYGSSLRERFKELPTSAVNIIHTLLSIEPEKRASATSALQSEYFHMKPYACHPANLPKYPPSKEIDMKLREEAQRKKAGGKYLMSGSSRNVRRGRKSLLEQTEACRSAYFNGLGSADSTDTRSDISQTTYISQTDTIGTLPALATTSSGNLEWSTKRRKQVSFATPTSRDVRPIEPIIHEQHFSYNHNEEERPQYSGPMLIQSHRTNGMKGHTRNGIAKSRLSRGKSNSIK